MLSILFLLFTYNTVNPSPTAILKQSQNTVEKEKDTHQDDTKESYVASTEQKDTHNINTPKLTIDKPNNKQYKHTLEIKGNKYFKEEAIENMLTGINKKSVKQIKEALFVTGFFKEINVQISEMETGHITTVITVTEKPYITTVRCHGNTLLSTTASLQAMDLYPGAIYDEEKLDKKKKQLIIAYKKRSTFHGSSIRYFFKNLFRTVDVKHQVSESADGIFLDIYIKEKFNYMKLIRSFLWLAFYCTLISIGVLVHWSGILNKLNKHK